MALGIGEGVRAEGQVEQARKFSVHRYPLLRHRAQVPGEGSHIKPALLQDNILNQNVHMR